jgi:hypothetical protein
MTIERQLRSEHRHGVRVAATVRAYRQPPLEALMRDISSRGAMLQADECPLMVGDEILLTAARQEVVATVAWQEEGYFGVAFHRALAPGQLATIRTAERG